MVKKLRFDELKGPVQVDPLVSGKNKIEFRQLNCGQSAYFGFTFLLYINTVCTYLVYLTCKYSLHIYIYIYDESFYL